MCVGGLCISNTAARMVGCGTGTHPSSSLVPRFETDRRVSGRGREAHVSGQGVRMRPRDRQQASMSGAAAGNGLARSPRPRCRWTGRCRKMEPAQSCAVPGKVARLGRTMVCDFLEKRAFLPFLLLIRPHFPVSPANGQHDVMRGARLAGKVPSLVPSGRDQG